MTYELFLRSMHYYLFVSCSQILIKKIANKYTDKKNYKYVILSMTKIFDKIPICFIKFYKKIKVWTNYLLKLVNYFIKYNIMKIDK